MRTVRALDAGFERTEPEDVHVRARVNTQQIRLTTRNASPTRIVPFVLRPKMVASFVGWPPGQERIATLAKRDLLGRSRVHSSSVVYNARVDRRSIEQYVHRDWEAVSASKLAYWAGRFRDEGCAPAWTAANGLLLDMRRARPDYPSTADRDVDVAAHIKVRERLDRIADAFTGR